MESGAPYGATNEKPQPDGAGAKLAILFVRIGRYSPA